VIVLDDQKRWWLCRNEAGEEGKVPSNYVKDIKFEEWTWRLPDAVESLDDVPSSGASSQAVVTAVAAAVEADTHTPLDARAARLAQEEEERTSFSQLCFSCTH
jgi:hypothetical protein